MHLILDLETTVTDDEQHLADLLDNIKPPANYKKDEAIDKWMSTNGADAYDKAVQRTALSPVYGRIVALTIAAVEDINTATTGAARIYTDHNHGNEIDLVPALRWLNELAPITTTTVVGYNTDFDLRFLRNRLIREALPMPNWLKLDYNRKYIVDVMRLIHGYSPADWVKLSETTRLLLPQIWAARPDNYTTKISDLLAAGDIDSVMQHNMFDVKSTMLLYKEAIR